MEHFHLYCDYLLTASFIGPVWIEYGPWCLEISSAHGVPCRERFAALLTFASLDCFCGDQQSPYFHALPRWKMFPANSGLVVVWNFDCRLECEMLILVNAELSIALRWSLLHLVFSNAVFGGDWLISCTILDSVLLMFVSVMIYIFDWSGKIGSSSAFTLACSTSRLNLYSSSWLFCGLASLPAFLWDNQRKWSCVL